MVSGSNQHSELDVQATLEWLKAEESDAKGQMNRTRDAAAWSYYAKQAGQADAAARVVTGLFEQLAAYEGALQRIATDTEPNHYSRLQGIAKKVLGG